MTATALVVVLVSLPLVVYLLAWLVRGVAWRTRETPAAALWVGIGVAYAAWVHPAFGLLAAVSAGWWLVRGWERAVAGHLWPLLAMAVSLGLQAPAVAVSLATAVLLTVGVLEVAIGVAQWWGLPIMRHPEWVHGTLGHRTGYGIYLALLVPLGFLTPFGWPLAACYAVGIALSKSSVAAGAAFVGLAVTVPDPVPMLAALPVAAGVVGVRALERAPGFPWLKWNHVGDSWRARWTVWSAAVESLRVWPRWLVGHGAASFESYARRWVSRKQLVEYYREAHNDYVELAFEYGAVGAVALGLLLWTLGPALRIGDPVTGSAAAFGTAMLANFPLRVAPLAGVGLFVAILLFRRVAT